MAMARMWFVPRAIAAADRSPLRSTSRVGVSLDAIGLFLHTFTHPTLQSYDRHRLPFPLDLLNSAPSRQRLRRLPAVKDDQGSAVEAQAIEIAAELLQPLRQGIGTTVSPDLELDSPALDTPRRGPADAEIDPTAPHRVLTVDEAAAIDHFLEERHEDELRRRLAVGRLGEIGLGVLAPEGAEIVEQEVEAQPPVRGDIGRARQR